MVTIAIIYKYENGSSYTDIITASDPSEFWPQIAFAQQALLDSRIASYEIKKQ